MPFKHNPGCCSCGCCDGKIVGYEAASWPDLVAFLDGAEHVQNIATINSSRLDELDLLFMGPQTCGPGISTPSNLWSDIQTWTENGGRLYVAGEYEGCISAANRDNINDFMMTIGSSMQLGLGVCNSGCANFQGSIGTPEIVQGLSGVWAAATAEVTGGTPLASTVAEPSNPETMCQFSYPFFAIEAMGSGFVILAGDSNVTTGCQKNCDFFCRWCERDDGEII